MCELRYETAESNTRGGKRTGYSTYGSPYTCSGGCCPIIGGGCWYICCCIGSCCIICGCCWAITCCCCTACCSWSRWSSCRSRSCSCRIHSSACPSLVFAASSESALRSESEEGVGERVEGVNCSRRGQTPKFVGDAKFLGDAAPASTSKFVGDIAAPASTPSTSCWSGGDSDSGCEGA